ncbi:MAG: hypothetical protein D6768_01190 [Chloroflexi bacterium]|nr:MAG: hypothetical protein D6768_01190 [Chloroflexota bacterium]
MTSTHQTRPPNQKLAAPWLRLNLPPELAQKAVLWAVSLIVLLALAAGGLLVAVPDASAPPTVKIGLVAPFEGEFRSTGYDVLFAVKLAVQERNREGVAGHRVELVALNDFNDPAEARQQAGALVSDPGIVGVIGHQTAAATAAALPVYRQAQLAVVVPWSADAAAMTESPGVVSVAATPAEIQARLQKILAEKGLSEPVILTGAGNPSLPATSAVADAIVLQTDPVSAGTILPALNAAGNARPIFGLETTVGRQLVQVAGPAADGLVWLSPGPAAADVPGAESFAQNYQAMAGHPPGPRAVLAYDAAHTLLDAVEQTMNLRKKWYNTRLSRSDVQHTVVNVRRQGLSGDVSFTNLGLRASAPVWVYQISAMNYPGNVIDR